MDFTLKIYIFLSSAVVMQEMFQHAAFMNVSCVIRMFFEWKTDPCFVGVKEVKLCYSNTKMERPITYCIKQQQHTNFQISNMQSTRKLQHYDIPLWADLMPHAVILLFKRAVHPAVTILLFKTQPLNASDFSCFCGSFPLMFLHPTPFALFWTGDGVCVCVWVDNASVRFQTGEYLCGFTLLFHWS